MSTAKTFTEKLIAARLAAAAVVKDAKNSHFKNTYATLGEYLAAVTPGLLANGLLLTQPVELKIVENRVLQVLRTVISDGTESVFSEMLLPEISDPQKLGSALTYYRRYSLAALLALAAEDDDANAAAGQHTNGHAAASTQRAEVRPALSNETPTKATPKQVNYIKGLLKARGCTDTDGATVAVTRLPLEQLNVAQAKKFIDMLQDDSNACWQIVSDYCQAEPAEAA